MAVPRPVLLAVLGLALCAAAFLATRGAKDPDGEITATPTPSAAAPTQAAKPVHKAKKHAAAPAASTQEQAEQALKAAAQDAAPAHTRAAQPAKPAHKPAAAPKPQPRSAHDTAVAVTRALGRGDAVVFFFTHHGAADDQRTRQAVQTLRGEKHVMIVQAGLEDLADYRPVLAGAGVSQVPSIVIVHADKPARLLEGYVDRGTLRQNVADALR